MPTVLKLIDQPGLDKSLRRAALGALGQIRTPESLAKLKAVLQTAQLPEKRPAVVPPTDELAFIALAALQTMSTPEANKVLQGLVVDRSYPTDLRREVVKQLGVTPAGCHFLLKAAGKDELLPDIKGEAAQVVNNSPDKKIREQAAKVLPLPKLAGNRTLPPISEILSKTGDARRGQDVFFKKDAQCSKCHRADGVGGWVGPDLSQIGGKFGKDGLLDSILNPSAAIAPEFLQYTVETQNGQLYAGVIAEETPERLVLKNAEGDRIIVPAREIASKTAMAVSLMPEGLVQNLTNQELVDLLAFLSKLKQPAVTVQEWQVAGPFAADVGQAGPENGINLKATYAGKDGKKVGWSKLTADREGRVDLESALGTRQAAAFLYAPVSSKAAQEGACVVLLPAGARASGWVNGKEVKFQAGAAPADPKTMLPSSADLPLKAGKNEVLLKIVGSDQAALTPVATLVSPQGVELPATGG